MLAVKSTLVNPPNRLPPVSAAEFGADAAAKGEMNSDLTAKPLVLFSIPPLQTLGDELFTASQFDTGSPADDVPQLTSTAGVVPLSVPNPNVVQILIQGARQRFIDLAGGSIDCGFDAHAIWSPSRPLRER